MNPILEAIKTNQAPKMAKMAAARGMLPLAPEEMFEALASLSHDEDDEVRTAVGTTLGGYNAAKLRPIIESPEISGTVLGFLLSWRNLPRELYQPIILHRDTPDEILAKLAAATHQGEVLDVIAIKQQSLIRHPAIIDAILNNPARTQEADRKVREVRQEFFEKEYGAQIIAEEQRAQAAEEAPAVAVEEPPVEEEPVTIVDDLLQYIEADLIDTGDALFEQFEAEFGPVDEMPGLIMDADVYEKIFAEEDFVSLLEDEDEFTPEKEAERVTILGRLATMSVKDKIKFGLKGNREVRMILIRDPNRPVCVAVIQNPKITEQEIEAIANLKSVHEEVLRLIGMNRNWTRKYNIVLTLVKNPRTPVGTTLGFLNRIQTRDLRELAKSKQIPDVVRQMASRSYQKRQQTGGAG